MGESGAVRVDKYLKVSRLIKRRTVAQEACSAGRVLVNGRQAKPGTEVEPGDSITVEFGNRTLEVEVLDARETASVSQAGQMYRVKGETRHGISSSDEHTY